MNKTVAKNAVILTVVEIISKAIEFLGFIVLARVLGAEKYGLMNFVYTVGTLFTLLPHFGFDQLVSRDISSQKENTGKYLVGISLTKMILFVFSLVLMVCWLATMPQYDHSKKMLLYLGYCGTFFLSNIYFSSSFFRAYQQASLEAVMRLTMALLVMVASIVCVLITDNLFYLFIVRLVIAAAIFLISVYLIITLLKPQIQNVFKPAEIFSYLKKGWPFAVSVLFIVIYVSIGVIMLNFYSGDHATGLYSVATKILVFFIIVPTGISNALLPALSQRINDDREGFNELTRRSVRFVLILAVCGAMFSVLLGKEIISIVFGKEFKQAGDILMVLSLSLIPVFINHTWNCISLAFKKEKSLVLFTAMGAAVNIILNMILIPRYSFYGAAIAIVLTETFIVIIQYSYIKFMLYPDMKVIKSNYLIFISGVLITLVGYNLKGTNPFIAFLFAFTCFMLYLFNFKYLNGQELMSFSKFLTKKKT